MNKCRRVHRRKEPYDVIKCDDNKFRKVEASCFLTMKEYREIVINQVFDI